MYVSQIGFSDNESERILSNTENWQSCLTKWKLGELRSLRRRRKLDSRGTEDSGVEKSALRTVAEVREFQRVTKRRNWLHHSVEEDKWRLVSNIYLSYRTHNKEPQ